MPPPRSPPSIFPTNPLLSYPLFETYRLSAHPSQSDVSTFPLPTSYHAARPQSAATGYKETKKRVEWNSMYDGTREDEFLWVDNEWNVVLGTLKEADGRITPEYSVLASLPVPIPSSSSTYNESPTLFSIPESHVILASSGGGDLVVIDVKEGKGHVVAEYELSLLPSEEPEGNSSTSSTWTIQPFLIHSATTSSSNGNTTIQAILSRTLRQTIEVARSKWSTRPARPETSFEVVCVEIPFTGRESEMRGKPDKLNVKWRLRSEELPKYCKAMKENDKLVTWIIGGPAGLEAAKSTMKEEDTDDISMRDLTPAAPKEAPTTPPYSWTQTSTSINIIFLLPTTVNPTRDIVCLLRPHTLDLQLFTRDGSSLSPALLSWLDKAGKTGRRDWWDAIRPDESTWTFERDQEGEVVKLEIHLEKANAGVRWVTVFAPWIELDNEGTVEEDEVAETVNEDVMAATMDRLQQFTSEFGQSGLEGGGGGGGIGTSLPGLMREEMEDEDDIPDGMQGSAGAGYGSSAKAGKELVVTYVEENGKVVIPMKSPETVLSYPLVVGDMDEEIILKSHVDGSVFSPPTTADSPWNHVATSPALSFVLSSKRDTQFVHHVRLKGQTGPTVFAFESRQARGMGGNVYIYFPPSDEGVGKTAGGKSKATTASQNVVKFGVAGTDGADRSEDLGNLLGVRMVTSRKDSVLVGLCEKALVVLSHIWG